MKPRMVMKIILFHLAVLGCTVAVPNGYYHQEYNYKTSSSSFKNNELQHKTDDQGYYRKDGDLDGRVKPVVDANSEHSEYVNPNSQGGRNYRGANTDFSSAGNMRAQSGYSGYGSNALDAEGIAQSDRIMGSRGYSSGYSSGYGSNSIGSNSASYGTSSNLRLITSRLQQELESELQEAVRQNNIYPQTRVDISQLERELRQNLTERLNNELIAKFGQQMVRGGMSYTITGGHLQSTANYDNEELSNLRSQLENTLMNQLRTQYSSSSTSNSQYYNRQGNYGYTTVRPVYHSVYPSLPSYTSTVRYPVDYTQAKYQAVRYTPITNPQSITNIASRIQSQLDTRLNDVLDETRRKYFSSSSSYSLTNTDVLLERIRNELRSNLTYLLDEDIRRNYGTQIQRDGYLYSVGPSGQTSADYNYSLRDLENLKQQVERNLIEKLNRDFETYRSSWSSHQSYNSQSSYGSNYQYSSTPHYKYVSSPRYSYTTPRYEVFTTPRQSYVNSYPTAASHHGGYIKTGGSASNQYDYASGSQQSGYGIQSSDSIAQLQRQLQDDLSRQLRGAISTGSYSFQSSSGGYNPQNYQTVLQRLSDELNRNLTRHLQEYNAMGSYAAYGNFDSAQMQRLKTQLQDNLMSQLQQGLQQSYQSSSSYSSSSSSSSNSNYRPVRGYENYQAGQYRSGTETVAEEDCAGDDPNAYRHVRAKRSYRFPDKNRNDGSQQGQQPTDLGQELDDYDSTQQIENNGFYGQGLHEMGHSDDYSRLMLSTGRDQTEVGQEIDDIENYLNVLDQRQLVTGLDLTQQVEDSGYGKLQAATQGQQAEYSDHGKLRVSNTGQQADDTYLSQQVEDADYSKLQFSNQGQQVDDSDSIPQVQDSGYEKLLISHQGQQVDTLGSTQEVEDSDYGKLQVSNQGQQVDDSDLTQQVEDSHYGKLNVLDQGQQVTDLDLTQQVEDSDYGNLHAATQGQQAEYSDHGKLQVSSTGQQVDDTYLSQQVEDSDYRKLQFSNQGQQVDDSDSIPQVQDSGYEKLLISHHSDLTQQVEDSDYKKLQVSSQSQQVPLFGKPEQHEIQPEQQVDNSDTHGKLNFEQPQVYENPEVSRQRQQLELGQQVDDSELIQHEVEHPGVGDNNPQFSTNQIEQLHNSEVPDQGRLISGQEQQVEDDRPIEPEGAILNNPKLQLGYSQQTEQPEFVRREQVFQNGDRIPIRQLVVNGSTRDGSGSETEHQTLISDTQNIKNNEEWCSRYIDTSLMDAPWTLSKQLEETIILQYHLLDEGTTKSQKDILYQKILAMLPRNIMYTCFNVHGMKLTEQEEHKQVDGLENYFKYLIKEKIDEVVQEDKNNEQELIQRPQEVETTGNKNFAKPELDNLRSSYESIEEWCTKYIDKSRMDAPWTPGFQLKSSVAKQCNRTIQNGLPKSEWQIIYERVMYEIPINITECFYLQSMDLNEDQLAEKRLDIVTHLQSLVKNEVFAICKFKDGFINQNQNILEQVGNTQKIENNPLKNQQVNNPAVPLGSLFPGQTGDEHNPQTPSANEIGPTPSVNKLLTPNQFTETDQKPEEILPQSQIIDDETDEAHVSQSVTPSSSLESFQPEQSEKKSFDITDQRQFIHRPQTLPEAEHTADSLINALRNSQTNRNDQQRTDDYRGYSYHGMQGYGSYGQHGHVYEDSRLVDRPHGNGYSQYPKYNRPGSSYDFQTGNQRYDNKPMNYNRWPWSYDSNAYITGYPHFHQQLHFNKPRPYGHANVVEQNSETSDLEPKTIYQANFEKPAERVYSGVKGRRTQSGGGYQPASSQFMPSQVQLEPVAVVRQDVAASQVVHEETTPLSTANENLPWWKKFGNKVKQGAADLKNKIIG